MKKTIALCMALAFCAAALIGCAQQSGGTDQAAPVVQVQSPASDTDESTLTVSATETVKAAPDIAYVYIGVRTTGADAEAAQQENARIMDAVTASLTGAGVSEDDVETSNISIYQDYENPDQYVMDNTYQVTIRDIDKVGEVIDAAAAAGANTTYSLSFDIEDRDAVYIEALGKAMQSIGDKAKAVAESGGYEILRPLSIQEGGSSSYDPRMAMDVTAPAAESAAAAGTAISPGDIEVSAGVTGTYVIQ